MNEKELLFNIPKDISKDRWCDIWRRNYDDISCEEAVRIGDEYYDKFEFPTKKKYPLYTIGTFPASNPIFENKFCQRFFDYICLREDEVKVVEFGGLLGNMARVVLDKHGDKIKKWINYELQTHAIKKNQCSHRQYTAVVASRFCWELDLDDDFNVFVASHSIEHIKKDQLVLLLEKIKNAKYIYLEAPISDDTEHLTPADNVNSFYGGRCGATHILEIGFEQISNILKDYFVMEEFSKPYILAVDEKEGNFFKRVRYKKGLIPLIFPKNVAPFRLPSQGFIRYDDGRNLGNVRCYIRREMVDDFDNKKEILKKDVKDFYERIDKQILALVVKADVLNGKTCVVPGIEHV